MTISEYREKYGTEIRQMAEKPAFVALMHTLRTAHPLHAIKRETPGNRIAGAVAFLNEIKGYDDCLDNIQHILTPSESAPEEPTATYEENEIPTPRFTE